MRTCLWHERRLIIWCASVAPLTWNWTPSRSCRWQGTLRNTSQYSPPSEYPTALCHLYRCTVSRELQILRISNEKLTQQSPAEMAFSTATLQKQSATRAAEPFLFMAVIESTLCTSITVWLGEPTQQDKNRLKRTIKTGEDHQCSLSTAWPLYLQSAIFTVWLDYGTEFGFSGTKKTSRLRT